MNNGNEISFCDRLRRLYDTHYKTANFTDKRGWSKRVARDLLANKGVKDTGLLPEWSETVYKKKRQDQPTYISGTLKKHLKYESAAECSGRWLEIYRIFFGCSAAYLFGDIDSFTPEYKTVQDITGLSPAAVKQLQYLNKNRGTMPVAAEMHDTLDLILYDAGNMADMLRAIGMVAGTVHFIDGDYIPEFPKIKTDDPAFLRVVEKERLYMAAENLSKAKGGKK